MFFSGVRATKQLCPYKKLYTKKKKKTKAGWRYQANRTRTIYKSIKSSASPPNQL